jgi:hypothetical protein
MTAPSRETFILNLQRLNDALAASPLSGKYHLFGGLLLGMVREGGPLAHDPDADFFYREEHQPEMDAAIPHLVRAGFNKKRRCYSNDGRLCEYIFERDGASFDFICFRPSGGDWLRYIIFSGGKQPLQIEKRYPDCPHEWVSFLDRRWLVPRDREKILTFLYGDWRTPDPDWNYAEEPGVLSREPWRLKWRREWRHPWSLRTLFRRLGQVRRRWQARFMAK